MGPHNMTPGRTMLPGVALFRLGASHGCKRCSKAPA